MTHLKISIVTPSFNQEEFLEQTILSVSKQKYPNLEYIVIDGGSSDSSLEIIKKYSSVINYWVSEKDNGHGDGLNKGFSVSTGEIMGWINSDDMLTSWSLRTVEEIFSKFPHVHWIQGFTSSWNRTGQMTWAGRNPKNIYDYLIGDYAWIQQESVFWRRSLWEKAGGAISTDMKFMVDGELWSRFFLYEQLYTVDCVLGGWRSYGINRASQNYLECLKEMEGAIEKMRSKCLSQVLATAEELLRYKNLARSRAALKTIGSGNTVKILAKTAAKKVFMNACYRTISWDLESNSWVEKTIPFR